MSHLEQLLVAFAGVGLTGWAFLHAVPDRRAGATESSSRAVFAMLFSVIIASAFNALYMGRMSSNEAVLELEQLLKPPYSPDLDFFRRSYPYTYVIFFSTATLIPMVAMGSLGYTYVQIKSLSTRATRNRLKVIWWVCFVVTVILTIANCASVLKVMTKAHALLGFT